MDARKLNEEARRIWEQIGPWWDPSVRDGDEFHRAFIFPTLEPWLALAGGERVLDAGCGNGALARRMARSGAEVHGVDSSSSLIDQARRRSPGIHFETMDLTGPAHLRALAAWGRFDRIVSSMVLH